MKWPDKHFLEDLPTLLPFSQGIKDELTTHFNWQKNILQQKFL